MFDRPRVQPLVGIAQMLRDLGRADGVQRIDAPGTAPSLSILAFSDCAAHDIGRFVAWTRTQPRPDLIVYAGDECGRFRPNATTNWLAELAGTSRYGLAVVLGNRDGEVKGSDPHALLTGPRVYDVHRSPIRLGPLLIGGIDGRSDEDTAARQLARLSGASPLLLVSHFPPHGVLDEATSVEIEPTPIGSPALATWCAARGRKPTVVVCGHCHRQGGRHDYWGPVTVVNAASHNTAEQALRVARITWELPTGRPTVEWHEHYDYDTMPLDGLTHRRARALYDAGIRSMAALAAAPPATVDRLLRSADPHARSVDVADFPRLPSRAAARLANTPIPLGPFRGPAAPRLFVRVEADPFPAIEAHHRARRVWVLGWVDEATDPTIAVQRVSATDVEERCTFREFAALCARPRTTVVTFDRWNFDVKRLIERFAHHGIPVPPALQRAVNLYHAIQRAIALPTSTQTVASAAGAFGLVVRHAAMFAYPTDAGRAARAAAEGLSCGDAIERHPILQYHTDSLRALRALTIGVGRACDAQSPAPSARRAS